MRPSKAETRLRFSRLRTTPARKPRTECCCHPVAFINASMLAPVGARSNSTALDCLVPERSDFCSCVLSDLRVFDRLFDFAAARLRFLEALTIGISLGLQRP